MLKEKHTRTLTTVLVLAAVLLIVPVIAATTTPQQQQAFAAGATGTEDPNGLLRLDPFAGYNYDINNEYYIQHAIKNFRESDDSMRIDFKGKNTDSFILAGYVNVVKGDGNNPDICTQDPSEEISTKINGGPHTGPNPDAGPSTFTDITPWPSENSADTIDVGNINFAGDAGRIRAESTHPSPLPTINMETGNTYPGQNLCNASPDDWVGFMTIKLNRDTNCDGRFDNVAVFGYLDTSGLNTDGTPQNKWTPAQGGYKTVSAFFKATDADIQASNLKAIFQYWGQYSSVGHTEDTYQTIRIDDQDYDAWTNTADPPYKHITLKQIINIHNVDCPTVDGSNPPGPIHPGTDDPDSLAAEEESSSTTTPSAEEGVGVVEEEGATTTTTTEKDDELAQEDDLQDPDNNDETADDDSIEEEEEE